LQQESIAAVSSEIGMILTHHWDEEDTYSKFYCEALKEVYEEKIYDFFRVEKKDVCYDVGSGGGEYAIYCAKNGADCLAFELRKDGKCAHFIEEKLIEIH